MKDANIHNFILSPIINPLIAEKMALYQCLINIRNYNSKKFIICTDSKLSLDRLAAKMTSYPLTSYIIFTIHNLQSLDIQVHFIWIPSRNKIIGNEIVDAAAKALSGKHNYYSIVNGCILQIILCSYR